MNQIPDTDLTDYRMSCEDEGDCVFVDVDHLQTLLAAYDVLNNPSALWANMLRGTVPMPAAIAAAEARATEAEQRAEAAEAELKRHLDPQVCGDAEMAGCGQCAECIMLQACAEADSQAQRAEAAEKRVAELEDQAAEQSRNESLRVQRLMERNKELEAQLNVSKPKP